MLTEQHEAKDRLVVSLQAQASLEEHVQGDDVITGTVEDAEAPRASKRPETPQQS